MKIRDLGNAILDIELESIFSFFVGIIRSVVRLAYWLVKKYKELWWLVLLITAGAGISNYNRECSAESQWCNRDYYWVPLDSNRVLENEFFSELLLPVVISLVVAYLICRKVDNLRRNALIYDKFHNSNYDPYDKYT